MNDRNKFQVEGVKWLQEMEMVNHPQFLNNLKLNILMVSKRIREVEFLIYREQKSILIYIELDWFTRRFSRKVTKKDILLDVNDVVEKILPSFRFRVVDDPDIMNLSITKVKNAITGGTKHESTTIPISKSANVISNSQNEQPTIESLNEVKDVAKSDIKE